jgi:protein-tyrosine phosphatase
MANIVSDYAPKYLFELQSPVYGGKIPSHQAEEAARIVKSCGFTDVIVLLEKPRGTAYQEEYRKIGLNALSFPIDERVGTGTASDEELRSWIPEILSLASLKNRRILIHCFGGIGRTGTISACAYAVLENVTGNDAIRKIRERIPGAIDSEQQEEAIRRFALKHAISEQLALN